MNFTVPLIIRGRIIEQPEVEFGGRREGASFFAPDLSKYVAKLGLSAPSQMADLYTISFEEIIAYIGQLSEALSFSTNLYLQEAYELARKTSGLSDDILCAAYKKMALTFSPEDTRRMVESTIGIPCLEGWVTVRRSNGYHEQVRALGARAVHVVAGNSPFVTAMSFVRNIVSRSDAIFKTPSNDPLTAAAIARTMIEMAPDHPITKHVSVAYWKGGDEIIENRIYDPRFIEKIIAWGGLASVSHITKYIRPGIDLVSLDPKLSSSIVGRQAFANEANLKDVARRLAHDIGYGNQELCCSARVIYVESGSDSEGLRKVNDLARLVYDATQALPSAVSGPARAVEARLAEELDGLRYSEDYRLVAGGGKEGGVIVSQIQEPVEFAHLLQNRYANLVPIDDLKTAVQSTTAYTQTVGVYPDELADELRDQLGLHGAQRVVSLGYASGFGVPGVQDGIEPLRRMCKWVLRETSRPEGRPMLADLVR